ncbi:hypothetical protein [Ktedonospora formicarum]|uniref:Uncharacterized protein n=1 Tax=Ktedonospora formicarum TaxID=2778364 RepID=A0A8J3MV07_9CHLR|nr:hypothetical protein [Ktedonospora formicarum]GHO47143.1 hypothetical protein KSX_53060 [Ktedonospora formicarum]
MNIHTLLLRLYPRHWRERYEEEFLVILTSHPFSWLEGIDIIRGAFDAHLHPSLGTADKSPLEKTKHMNASLRSSLLIIFCAYIGIILPGMGLQKMAEDAEFQRIASTSSPVGITFTLVIIGAISALLAVVIGGVPIVISAIRSALVRKRYELLVGLAVPVLVYMAFLNMTQLHITLFPQGSQPSTPEHILIGRTIFVCMLLIAAIASAGSVCFTVARSDVSEHALRFAVVPSTLATLSMVLIAMATILCGFATRASASQFFAGNHGIVDMSTSGTWLGISLAMIVTSVLAVIGLVRGLSVHSTLHKITA